MRGQTRLILTLIAGCGLAVSAAAAATGAVPEVRAIPLLVAQAQAPRPSNAGTAAVAAPVLSAGDAAIVDMSQAFRRGERARLQALLPAVRGHLLEPWGHYWDMRLRLDSASADEVRSVLARLAGTYQEDRLRNDWLDVLGQRRDWPLFLAEVGAYRMNDDREVRCYRLVAEHLTSRQEAEAQTAAAREAHSLWMAQRDRDDGCTFAVETFFKARRLNAVDIWQKARQAAEANRSSVANDAVAIVAPQIAARVGEAMNQPARLLRSRATAPGMANKELMVLALARLAQTDPDDAFAQLDQHWSVQLTQEERSWAWGAIGRAYALRLSPRALEAFANGRPQFMSDEHLAWWVRAALRDNRWREVLAAVAAMSPAAQQDPAWVYWRARAQLAGRNEAERTEARAALERLAGMRGFYEKLAAEELGLELVSPPAPAPLTDAELAAARQNPGLQRGLAAIALGLRSDGVREWNYTVALHTPGGMNDRELLAAAQMACDQQVWDRCINTSERTRSVVDVAQRFPMPHRDAVLRRTKEIGLDPSYVYGLIRQESRFIMDARSSVGASGLMQVMPATARWTARRIGMDDFTVAQLNDRDTNIAIGTAYLKLVLDDFEGSMPLAAAAYNAGPSRSRLWRAPQAGTGPVLEGAIWAENVPFTETRDYVKKVLSNATDYAALITGQPQSLKARLGRVGPRPPGLAEVNRDLP